MGHLLDDEPASDLGLHVIQGQKVFGEPFVLGDPQNLLGEAIGTYFDKDGPVREILVTVFFVFFGDFDF